MGDLLDAPNQQVVRPDGSGPADEGEGGSTHPEPEPAETKLASHTKSELLKIAEARGADADDSMTKAELVDAIEATED